MTRTEALREVGLLGPVDYIIYAFSFISFLASSITFIISSVIVGNCGSLASKPEFYRFRELLNPWIWSTFLLLSVIGFYLAWVTHPESRFKYFLGKEAVQNFKSNHGWPWHG